MAKTKDIAAEKARKQKIILAVVGVLMVGLAVIQVPKIMKKDAPPAAAPAAAATPGATTPGTVPGTTTPAAATATYGVSKPAAYVAGVALPGTAVAPVATSKLASFTLFEPKDPFVQQVGDETGLPVVSDASAAPAAPGADKAAAPGAGAGADSGTAPVAKPVPITYATVMYNGVAQQLQLKQKFPEVDPTFVLVSLKKKQAKIGVAGGTFGDGKNVTLVLGQSLTLVNTANGVRYVLKLVYTGATPETIESFSTGDAQSPPAEGAPATDAPAAAAPVEGAPTATPAP